jgi:hypothetical protein
MSHSFKHFLRISSCVRKSTFQVMIEFESTNYCHYYQNFYIFNDLHKSRHFVVVYIFLAPIMKSG